MQKKSLADLTGTDKISRILRTFNKNAIPFDSVTQFKDGFRELANNDLYDPRGIFQRPLIVSIMGRPGGFTKGLNHGQYHGLLTDVADCTAPNQIIKVDLFNDSYNDSGKIMNLIGDRGYTVPFYAVLNDSISAIKPYYVGTEEPLYKMRSYDIRSMLEKHEVVKGNKGLLDVKKMLMPNYDCFFEY